MWALILGRKEYLKSTSKIYHMLSLKSQDFKVNPMISLKSLTHEVNQMISICIIGHYDQWERKFLRNFKQFRQPFYVKNKKLVHSTSKGETYFEVWIIQARNWTEPLCISHWTSKRGVSRDSNSVFLAELNKRLTLEVRMCFNLIYSGLYFRVS